MESCKVPSNPDIAGIGVRAAVYIMMQALLAIINSFLQEGEPRKVTDAPLTPSPTATHFDVGAPPAVRNVEEVEKRRSAIKTEEDIQSLSIVPGEPVAGPSNPRLVPQRKSTSVSEVVQCILDPQFAQSADRDLEWSLFVTGSAFVTSALIQAFAKSSSGLTDYHALVVLNLSFINYWAGVDLLRRRTTGPNPKGKWNWKIAFSLPFKTRQEAWRTIDSWLPFYLHATLFSVLGIIFWSRQDLFQTYLKGQNCKTTPTVYWAFRSTPLGNRTLKITSLMFYSLSVIPIINGLFTQILWWIVAGLLTVVGAIVALFLLIIALVLLAIGCRLPYPLQPADSEADNRGSRGPVEHHYLKLLEWSKPFYRRATTIVYMAPVLYWIVATEILVHSNASSAQAEDGNAQRSPWTYGQVMSLMTACVIVLFYCRQVKDKVQEGDKPQERDLKTLEEEIRRLRGENGKLQEENQMLRAENRPPLQEETAQASTARSGEVDPPFPQPQVSMPWPSCHEAV